MSDKISPKVLIKMGEGCLSKRDFYKATEYFLKAYEINSADKNIISRLCECYLALGEGKNAFAKSKELLKQSQNGLDLLKVLKSNNPTTITNKFLSRSDNTEYISMIVYLAKSLFLINQDDKGIKLLPILNIDKIHEILYYCQEQKLFYAKHGIENHLSNLESNFDYNAENAKNPTLHFLKTFESIEFFKKGHDLSNNSFASDNSAFAHPTKDFYQIAKEKIYNNACSALVIDLLRKALKQIPGSSEVKRDLSIELFIKGGFKFNFTSIVDSKDFDDIEDINNKSFNILRNNTFIKEAISYFETFTLSEEIDFKISLALRLAQKLEYEASKYVLEQINIGNLNENSESDIKLLIKISEAYLIIGRKSKAKNIVQKVLEANESFSEGQTAMIRCLIREKSYDNAKELLGIISEDDKTRLFVKLLEFVCMSLDAKNSNKKLQAETIYKGFSQPEQRLAREFLTEEKLYQNQIANKVDISASSYDEICTILQKADEKIKLDLYGDAEEIFRKGIKDHPSSYSLLASLCDLLLRKKKYKQALKYSEKMLKRSFPNPAPYIYYAASLFEKKRHQDAYTTFKEAISLYEPNIYRYGLLIEHHRGFNKNVAEYVRLSGALLKKYPNDIVTLLNLKNIYFDRGDLLEELDVTRKLALITDENAEKILNSSKRAEYLLEALKRQSNWSEIVKVSSKMLKSDPMSKTALDYIIEAHDALGHDDLAQEATDNAILYYPEDIKYKNLRIQYLLKAGDLSEVSNWIVSLPKENQKVEYGIVIENLYQNNESQSIADFYANYGNTELVKEYQLSKATREKILYSLYNNAIQKEAVSDQRSNNATNNVLPTLSQILSQDGDNKTIFEDKKGALSNLPLENFLDHINLLHEEFLEVGLAQTFQNTLHLIKYTTSAFADIADIRIQTICSQISEIQKKEIEDAYIELQRDQYSLLTSSILNYIKSEDDIDWNFAFWAARTHLDYDVDNQEALLLHVKACRGMGDLNKAVEICNKAIQEETKYKAEFLYEKGISLYEGKQYNEAFDTLEVYLNVSPQSLQGVRYIVLTLLNLDQNSEAYDYLTKIDSENKSNLFEFVIEMLFVEEQYNKLLALAQRFKDEIVCNEQILKYQIQVLIKESRYKEAREFITRCSKLNRSNLDLLVLLSYAYYKDGSKYVAKEVITLFFNQYYDCTLSLAMMNSYLTYYKFNTEYSYHEFLSICVFDSLLSNVEYHVKNGDYQAAFDIIDEIKKNNFRCINLYKYEVLLRHQNNEIDVALEIFEKCFKNYPDDNSILEDLYKFYVSCKRYNARCYQLLEMLETKTDFREEPDIKILICLSNSKYNEAINQIKDSPQDIQIAELLKHSQNADILSDEQRLYCLDQVLKLDTKNLLAAQLKGIFLIDKRDFKGAIAFLKEASKHKKDDISLLQLLVRAYNEIHDFRNAASILYKVLQSKRNSSDYKKIRSDYVFLLLISCEFDKIEEVCSDLPKKELITLLDDLALQTLAYSYMKRELPRIKEYILQFDDQNFDRVIEIGKMYSEPESRNYNFAKGVLYFKRGIALKSDNDVAYEELSTLYLDNSQYKEVINLLTPDRDRLILNRSLAVCLQVVTYMNLMPFANSSDNIKIKEMHDETLYVLARHLLKVKTYDKALAISEELISRKNPDGYSIKAMRAKELCNYEEAIIHYKRSIATGTQKSFQKQYIDTLRIELIEVCAYARKENLIHRYLRDLNNPELTEVEEFRAYYIMGNKEKLENTSLYIRYQEKAWSFIENIIDQTSNNDLLAQANKSLNRSMEYA